MNKTLISLPYIYPICPLNINHAKMFIIGDIVARFSRKESKEIFFNIASHYSGNSAENISNIFHKIFSGDNVNEKEKSTLDLYKNVYKTPNYILRSFSNPHNILDFYNQEIIWELKSLNISCDYKYFYTTKNKDFSVFVNTIMSKYQENNLLIRNKKGELALDYDKKSWKEMALDLLNNTEFFQSFHKNNIKSTVKNVRSDWGLLRKEGFGVKYKRRWIIDPMFDSELFTIFDLYVQFKSQYSEILDVQKFFEDLFDTLKNAKKTGNILINKIIDYLPCDVFICEEHLKNWIVKKIYAESFLLNKKYRTQKYYIIGMGLLDGKIMSASRGHAILVKDLLQSYGPIRTRMIILLTGGHPSKEYNYDRSLPEQVNKLLYEFINYFIFLISIKNKGKHQNERDENPKKIQMISKNIEKYIKDGYYRQAIIELFSIIPRKNKFPSPKTAFSLISIYEKYLEILLPGLLEDFNIEYIL